MGAIIPWLGRILGYLSEALGILSVVQSLLGLTAKEDQLIVVRDIAQSGTTAVQDPISGTHAIWALVEAVQSGGTPSLQTITDLLAGLTPTPLPPEPPIDWPGTIGAGVLQTPLLMPWWFPETLVRNLDVALFEMQANLMGMSGAAGFPSREAPDFALVGYSAADMWAFVYPPSEQYREAPTQTDWTDWDGVETLATLLTRTQPRFAWSLYGPAGFPTPDTCWGRLIGGSSYFIWRCLVNESQLPVKSGRLWDALSGLSIHLPPVWPGLAGVTLGTPVALDQGVDVVGPLHGVLLDITATERLIPSGTMGAYHTYRNLGRFAFYNDDGWFGEWQGVPSDHCQLLVKGMAEAAGVWFTFYTGVTGTATPFTIGGA
jgi:hypothetical protein